MSAYSAYAKHGTDNAGVLMFVIAGTIVNEAHIKCASKTRDHIVIEFNDTTNMDISFNSEPEAGEALKQLISILGPTYEIDKGEVVSRNE